MGWVKDALKDLAEGKHAQVRPIGGSMRGRIESGQLVTIAPVPPEHFEVDDVVFVEWQRNYLLHLVKDIKEDQVLIGNNVSKINGWVKTQAVKGKVVSIDDESESC